MSEYGYSYSAWSLSPDNSGNLTFTGADGDRFRRYLIPLKATTDRLKANNYCGRFVITATNVKPNPTPTGRMRLGLYRRVGPQGFASAVVNWELVAGSTYSSSAVTGGSSTIDDPAFDNEIDVDGGEFFACYQFEDNTSSGPSNVAFTVQGFTAVDTNLEYAYVTTTGTAGALPSTINGNIATSTDKMPFAGVWWK